MPNPAEDPRPPQAPHDPHDPRLERLYQDLRRHERVRRGPGYALVPRPVRRVLQHPDFEEKIRPRLERGFASRKERTRWLFELNFLNSARHRLRAADLEAYLAWLRAGLPAPLPAPSRPMSTSMGSDAGGGGRRRAVRTPSSQEFYRTHALRLGRGAVPFPLLLELARRAPAPLRGPLERLLAPGLPPDPPRELLEALAWLGGALRARGYDLY